MYDVFIMYFAALGFSYVGFMVLRYVFKKRAVRALRIMSKVATVFLCTYPFQFVVFEKNERLDKVVIPISLIIILFWRFYLSYLFFSRTGQLNKKKNLIIGGVYCCVFLLGLPIYPYLCESIQNIIGITFAVINAIFLIMYFYRKWKK